MGIIQLEAKMDFRNSETLKNLTRAFAAECQDGAKYQYMADMATQQKLSQVSTILKQLATNEMAHGKVFYDYIGSACEGGVDMVEIKATYPMQHSNLVEMLKIKAENEQRQFDSVYPNFAKVARKEGFDDIATKIEQIAKIEACHAKVLSSLYQMLKNSTLYSFDEASKLKCMNCGHEDTLKKGWKKCPICGFDQGYIKITLTGDAEQIE